MVDLQDYSINGTIQIIVNNQIVFKTVPEKGRSIIYASDLAKSH
jgi:2-oxoglutarate decarboxylase